MSFVISLLILIVPTIGKVANIHVLRQAQTAASIGRIDCYPELESVYSNFSQAACLARGCVYDNNSIDIPCYFKPNYGYTLQGNQETITNGIRINLRHNQAVISPFPEPIENVTLDVTYYTNDIIRFKLYDANNSRYEVRSKVKILYEI